MCLRFICTSSLLLLLWLPGAQAAPFEKLLMPGPLSAAHAGMEEECGSCHDPLGEKSQAQLCATCHEEVAEDMAADTGFHGKHPDVQTQQCQSCHREHEGVDAVTLAFELTPFDHNRTDFALVGPHEGLDCASCHMPGEAHRAAPSTCVGCHQQDDVHNGALGTDCGACHLGPGWQKPSFDHARSSFPLLGAHRWLNCDSCHEDQLFVGTAMECAACHRRDDVHGGEFGQDCGSCHSESAWTNTNFDHGSTGFFLRGAHGALACKACHASPHQDKALGTTCVSCHQQDDPHQGRRGSDCAGCHNENNWQATFDHAAKTGFSLLGAHAALTCSTCHKQSMDEPLPTTCSGCHSPDPHAGQLGNNCESCHNNTSFTANLRFDHQLSTFPLLGLHALLQCDDCHAGLRFHDAAESCESCHAADDPHQGRMGTSCGSCHNPVGWAVTKFDHGQKTGFELSGHHADLSCESCHQHPVMLRAESQQECSQCHKQDDPHEGEFGRNCGQCHNTSSFAEITGFGP